MKDFRKSCCIFLFDVILILSENKKKRRTTVNLFEALEWSNWKNLSIEVKIQVISQVLMYFVSPLKQVGEVEYCEFELAGVKCATFECSIDGERFVLIPGNQKAILGWDLGVQGLPVTSWDCEPETKTAYFKQLAESYGFSNADDWEIFVNESTSPLRKVKIPPMLVQKEALPTGTTYIGNFDTITGEFTGLVEAFAPIEKDFRSYFKQPTSFEESLTWQLPDELYEANHFYAFLQAETETYRVYLHQTCSRKILLKKTHDEVFDLLDEDQWEYAVGAGTRKLFRWGNEVEQDLSFYGKKTLKKMQQENMFGLLIDSQRKRWEVTDSKRLKLEKMELTGHPLFDTMPLSSYYHSRKMIADEELLEPCDYSYRKAIIIRSE